MSHNTVFHLKMYATGNLEVIHQVAPLHNSLTASVLLPQCTRVIHYIQHLLTHVVDMPYINNSWSLKEFKELKKIK